MADIRIENKEDFERWLNGIPNEDERRRVAIALASRAAMRLIPGLISWLNENPNRAIHTILATFFSTNLAWVICLYLKDINLKIKSISVSAIVDDIVSKTALQFEYSSNDAALIANCSSLSLKNVYSNINSIHIFSTNIEDTYSNIMGFSGHSKAREALRNDIYIINKKGLDQIIYSPLWPQGTPTWAADLWQSMKSRLLARKGEHWEVWTNWYDARLDPSRHIPCYSPYIPELERQRVLLPEDLWDKGPAAVNAAIKRLIEEHECSKQGHNEDPVEPEELEGIRFELDDEGRLHELRQPPEPDEAADPLQQQMFARLKQKLAQLMSHADKIGNQYADLVNVLRDYDRELSVASLQELDVPALWMAGLGLMEQAEAFRRMDDETALTPRLEPEVEGLLGEVAGLHGAFITGFRKGRELVQRRLQGQYTPEELERLKEAQESFISAARQLPSSALSERARQILQSARDLMELRAMSIEAKVGALLHLPVNILIAVGRKISTWIFSGMATAMLGSEGVQAWMQFLQSNGGTIASIAVFMPELRAYLRHLYDLADWPWPEHQDRD